MKKIGILFAYLATSFILLILFLSLIFRINPLDFFKQTQKLPALNISYIVLQYFLILLIVHLQAKKDNKNGIQALGLSFSNARLRLIIISSLAAFLLFAFYLVILKLGKAVYFSKIGFNFAILLIQGIIFGFLFSLVEEILFRGYILQTLLDEHSPIFSFSLTSLIFALLHLFRPGSTAFKILYFLGLFTTGMILAYAFYKTLCLWIPITIHTSWITCNYTLPSLVTFNSLKYESFSWFWGMNQVLVAGVAGIIILLLYLGILHRILKHQKLPSF